MNHNNINNGFFSFELATEKQKSDFSPSSIICQRKQYEFDLPVLRYSMAGKLDHNTINQGPWCGNNNIMTKI